MIFVIHAALLRQRNQNITNANLKIMQFGWLSLYKIITLCETSKTIRQKNTYIRKTSNEVLFLIIFCHEKITVSTEQFKKNLTIT